MLCNYKKRYKKRVDQLRLTTAADMESRRTYITPPPPVVREAARL
jgi:hypothetical protein